MDLTELKAAIDEYQAASGKALTENRESLKALAAEVDQIVTRMNRPLGGGGPDPFRQSSGEREMKSFVSFLRYGPDRMPGDEMKSLMHTPDTAGGYLAPEEFLQEILRNVVLFSPIRSVARVQQISAGAVLLPKRTSGMTAAWVPEVGARPETTVTFSQLEFGVKEAACWVDCSNALLEDAAFDLPGELAFEFAEEFGRIESASFVNGVLPGEPAGFAEHPSIAYTPSGSGTDLTCDSLINLFHAVAPPYRVSGAWLMNSSTLAKVRQLKTAGDGVYLLNPAGIAGAPATTLLGKPVVECPDLPDVAGGAYPVYFGDWRQGYRIFDRIALTVLRNPYTQAGNGQTRFHARRRVAGGVGKPEAIRKLKIATS